MAPHPPPPVGHATTWAADTEGRRYELGRPDYPAACLPLLADRLGLRRAAVVADLAAGTGKLTRLLTRTPATVVAIEPMPGMRRQLRRQVPGAAVTAGRAEAIPLRSGSLDAVTVAQAFHWFELERASREIRRVLRPGGRLATVTNRGSMAEPWARDLWGTLERYERLAPRRPSTGAWRAGLEATGDWEPPTRVELGHEQRFASLEEFDARFASISYVILLDEATRSNLLRDLRAVVAGMDPLVVPMTTDVRVWTRRP